MTDIDRIRELIKRMEKDAMEDRGEDVLKKLDEIHEEGRKKECKLTSPNDMFTAAKKTMLSGKEPETPEDWSLIINYFAHNIEDGCEMSATRLLAKIFAAPLPEDIVEKIVNFQIDLKRREKRKHN